MRRGHLAGEPERRRRAALLNRLLTRDLTAEQASHLLVALGSTSTTVRGIAIHAGPDEAAELAGDIALALPGGLVRAAGGIVEALATEDVDVDTVLARFAPGRPAGIGAPVPARSAAITMQQARSLIATSARLGRPAASTEDNTSGFLLSIGPPEVLAGFSDHALAPLDGADPRGELAATLRVWLDSNGVADIAADRLGVHRHTVRNRLDKIQQLLGRRLDDAATRYEVWLALKARDTLTQQPGPT